MVAEFARSLKLSNDDKPPLSDETSELEESKGGPGGVEEAKRRPDEPEESRGDETHRTQSSGSAVVTSPTNTKPTTLATGSRLPLVSVMDQNGGGTEVVCTVNGLDPGNVSSSSRHASISAQLPRVGKVVWEVVPSESGGFGDNQTTMDLPPGRHEPLHTCESAISSRVIPVSVSVEDRGG